MILPGGNTAYLHAAITDGRLREKVIAAVERGWNCLGFCSGANVLCEDAILYKQGKMSDRFSSYAPLATVLPGIEAHLPCLPVEAFNSAGGQNHRIVNLQTKDGVRFQTFWNEGSAFAEQDGVKAEGIAYYDEPGCRQAAVVKRAFGSGTAVICDPHPEISFSFAQEQEPRENYRLRLAFLHELFRSVGIVPNGESGQKYFY